MSRTLASATVDLRAARTSSVALVEEALAAIDAHAAHTNAFVTVDREGALAAARTADRDRQQQVNLGPLHGLPISLKDLIDVAGVVTTAGSRVLAHRVAPADATVVTRLRDAGAIIIGRTNLHEFALGTTSEDSAFGPVRHPRDHRRSAGGSSGGSAVAVATGMGLASIGTDTGGSVRIPASVCGVVGLKPTLGEVPTDGVIPLSTSLDHVGPITRTVEDAALLWKVLANTPTTTAAPDAARPLRLGRLGGYFDALDERVRAAFEGTLTWLKGGGVETVPAAIANVERAPAIYVNIVLPEGAAWHARYLDTHGDGYTTNVRARLESGRNITAMAYLEALAARAPLTAAVDAALADVDALVLPTLPIVAPVIGEADVVLDARSGQTIPVRAAMLKHTQVFNLSGHPAITLPMPVQGLPAGLQLVGRRGDTAGLLAIAATCERIGGLHA